MNLLGIIKFRVWVRIAAASETTKSTTRANFIPFLSSAQLRLEFHFSETLVISKLQFMGWYGTGLLEPGQDEEQPGQRSRRQLSWMPKTESGILNSNDLKEGQQGQPFSVRVATRDQPVRYAMSLEYIRAPICDLNDSST